MTSRKSAADKENASSGSSKLYVRENYLSTWSDAQFHEFLGMNKPAFRELLKIVEGKIFINERAKIQPQTIQVWSKLIATIRFLITGRTDDAQMFSGIVAKAIYKHIFEVLKAVASVKADYVKFPSNLAEVKRQFSDMSGVGFPHCIGSLDCTFIETKTFRQPSHLNSSLMAYGLNVQTVCGPNLEIFDIDANSGGAVPDAEVYLNSQVKDRLDNGDLGRDSLFVTDRGYYHDKNVMVPFSFPLLPAEKHFNAILKQMQFRHVERQHGRLKGKFDSLNHGLNFQIDDKYQIMIEACAVVHNIILKHSLPTPAHVSPSPRNGDLLLTSLSSFVDRADPRFERRIEIANVIFANSQKSSKKAASKSKRSE